MTNENWGKEEGGGGSNSALNTFLPTSKKNVFAHTKNVRHISLVRYEHLHFLLNGEINNSKHGHFKHKKYLISKIPVKNTINTKYLQQVQHSK
jgi:hypothetical protein